MQRVAEAIVQDKTRVIDIDLQAYFAHVRHPLLLAKVAQRGNDPDILHRLQLILKAAGKQGVPQGGVLSPLLRHLYLTEGARMLERAKEVPRRGQYPSLESARLADDLGSRVDAYAQHAWLRTAVEQRLREALAILHVPMKATTSRSVDRAQGERCGFLGVALRRVRSRPGTGRAYSPPLRTKRTALLRKLKDRVRRHPS